MTEKVKHAITGNTITCIINGQSHLVTSTSPHFEQLRAALKAGEWDLVRKLASPKLAAEAWADGEFTLKGNNFSYRGEPLPKELNKRIMEMISQHASPQALFRFWERLDENISMRAREGLYTFLTHMGIPLTRDGFFLAYKGVRQDFYDAHTGKNLNKPGQRLSMPRKQISDDPNVPCHRGLHVGDLSYAKGHAARVVICKVDPADVVCIPNDESYRKMRVCAYEVVGLHAGGKDDYLPGTVFLDSDVNLEDSGIREDDDKDFDAEGYSEEDIDDDEDEDDDEDDDDMSAFLDVDVDEEDNDDGTTTVRMRLNGDGDLRDVMSGKKKVAAKAKTKTKDKERVKHTKLRSSGVPREYKRIHKMDSAALGKESMADLRLYATHGLHIVGIGHLRGGKDAVIDAILAARK